MDLSPGSSIEPAMPATERIWRPANFPLSGPGISKPGIEPCRPSPRPAGLRGPNSQELRPSSVRPEQHQLPDQRRTLDDRAAIQLRAELLRAPPRFPDHPPTGTPSPPGGGGRPARRDRSQRCPVALRASVAACRSLHDCERLRSRRHPDCVRGARPIRTWAPCRATCSALQSIRLQPNMPCGNVLNMQVVALQGLLVALAVAESQAPQAPPAEGGNSQAAPSADNAGAAATDYKPAATASRDSVAKTPPGQSQEHSVRSAGSDLNIDRLIDAIVAPFGVDPVLARALIHRENRGGPLAVSSSGAKGLMQLMPNTTKRFGVDAPFEPEQNIRARVQYPRDLPDRNAGNLELAMTAHIAGQEAVDRHGGNPPSAASRAFVAAVLRTSRKANRHGAQAVP